jgi:hypothetical protein
LQEEAGKLGVINSIYRLWITVTLSEADPAPGVFALCGERVHTSLRNDFLAMWGKDSIGDYFTLQVDAGSAPNFMPISCQPAEFGPADANLP